MKINYILLILIFELIFKNCFSQYSIDSIDVFKASSIQSSDFKMSFPYLVPEKEMTSINKDLRERILEHGNFQNESNYSLSVLLDSLFARNIDLSYNMASNGTILSFEFEGFGSALKEYLNYSTETGKLLNINDLLSNECYMQIIDSINFLRAIQIDKIKCYYDSINWELSIKDSGNFNKNEAIRYLEYNTIYGFQKIDKTLILYMDTWSFNDGIAIFFPIQFDLSKMSGCVE